MIADQPSEPELDAPAPGRSTDAVQRVMPCPEQDVSRWEDDGGAVLPSAHLPV